MTALQQAVSAILPARHPALDEALDPGEELASAVEVEPAEAWDDESDGDTDMDSKVEIMLTRPGEVHSQADWQPETAKAIARESLLAFARSTNKGKGKGDKGRRFEPS